MNKLIDIFCDVDDFCYKFLPVWEAELIANGTKKRRRQSKMSTSECMTIVIAFHQYNHRDFKNFYIGLVQKYWREYFPNLLSYTRFLHKMYVLLVPMCAYFQTVKGKPTGIAFVDSTSLKVCPNIRIPRNRVFDGVAKRGKGTIGWSYGFKLHLLINHVGEIISLKITPGNTNDRTPIPELCKNLSGKLYADKGYIGKKLTEKLAKTDVDLVTTVGLQTPKINVGYREFSNNSARPAFNNDVEYDLSSSNLIGYKGASIEVIKADNSSITYKVIKNFP
ncbi:IS982 family transposase [Colwellia sp. MSW7]|uniref:IS982 family transposase n=1 Tax=Colwellia maritima TaxID=2912588 RepID=A0ABS9X7S9_9GAMM|nr:IS982 family transposase [Colwellia maritima]MCI2286140.1 IS982 family transposase [Colwellia maritima]